MTKQIEPDQILVKMPSLRAVKSFVAAAKYQNFTRAAESLCVTQAAISRQIRELEFSLGVELFHRAGKTVTLTEEGTKFYDAAYLSFMNISQAARRIQKVSTVRNELSIACTPAFTQFWLTPQLRDFFQNTHDIHISVISTNNLMHEISPNSGSAPDICISKVYDQRDGYKSIPLFHDVIYPVCSPEYLKQHDDPNDLQSLISCHFLNLTPYGRDQVAEHVDWEVWLKAFNIDFFESDTEKCFNANDYCMLIQMAMSGHGVCLGWHHLVGDLVDQGKLVKVTNHQLTYKQKCHYLSYPEKLEGDPTFLQFKNWLLKSLQRSVSDVCVAMN
ncbi:LysR family transcriptional regulator [Marinomonas fungiae]|uniref:LysR family transcriptional regulator n=1 Tax=Marinomonas fungiae TaxID=1137284 RepID=UPI003A8CB471